MNLSAYAVIPNYILCNENLSDFDIRVYAIISQLANQNGFCYAKNEYLSQILNKTTISISNSINRIAKNGFFILEYDKFKNRKIYISKDFYERDSEKTTIKTQENQSTAKRPIIQTQELNTIDDEPNLPFFIDLEVWHKYLRYKSERREVIGAMQKEQLFQTLAKMHEQGIDVNQAILNSIANGYKGIFGEKQKVDINSQDYAMQKTREACERLAKIYEAKEKAECEANVSRETNKGANNGF